VLQAHKEKEDLREQLALLARLVPLVLQVHKVFEGKLAPQAQLVPQALKVYRA
jgi:hypothetical protein